MSSQSRTNNWGNFRRAANEWGGKARKYPDQKARVKGAIRKDGQEQLRDYTHFEYDHTRDLTTW